MTRAGLTTPDENLPEPVRVRHGRNSANRMLHYYFNFSSDPQSFTYSYGAGSDLLTTTAANRGQTMKLAPWDVVIIAER